MVDTSQPSGAIVAVGQAGSAAGKLLAPDLEGLKQLVTQTKAIGVILPPPDIRAIVDKTAQFVAKNGTEFERRILSNEANNVKFSFLNPTDPYHAYYRLRVTHFQDELKGESAGEKPPADSAAAKAQQAVAAATAVAQAPPQAAAPAGPAPATTRPLEKPADEKYTVHVPEGMAMLDVDIIKLTAQFVARNGKNFLTGLAQREAANPQFNFLKPTHSMFGFFTALADAYSAVLMPEKDTKAKLQADMDDRGAILERCLKRLEWEKVKAEETRAAADAAEAERMAMLSIDWHDFVVVETIDFYDGEDEALPPPLSLKQLLAMNRQQLLAGAEEAAAEEEVPAEQEAAPAPMDAAEQALLAEAGAAQQAAGPSAAPEAAEGSEDMDMDVDMDVEPAAAPKPPLPEPEEDEAPIKVVKNYVRQVPGVQQSFDPTKFVVSPITGEVVPIEEMAEHMRISLIDPRYREQKEAMLAKIRDTTRAGDDEITRNLVGLARTRPDIFGSTQEEVSSLVSAAVNEKMMSGAGRAEAWDGATKGGDALKAQMTAISQQRQDLAASGATLSAPPMPARPAVGPSAVAPPGGFPPPPSLPPPVLPPPPRPNLPPPPATSLPPPPATSLPPPPAGDAPASSAAAASASLPRAPLVEPPRAAPVLPRPAMPPMGGFPPPPGIGLPGPPPGGPPSIPALGGPPGSMPGFGGPHMGGPEAKRPRFEFVLEPESDFLARHPGIGKVRVQCPEAEGYEKLTGQLLEVEVASLQDTVGELKQRLAGVLDVPANKQKLNREGVGFLKDEYSLAHYNVSPDTVLTLSTKERGGRKK